jgi:GTP-binding protein HflX
VLPVSASDMGEIYELLTSLEAIAAALGGAQSDEVLTLGFAAGKARAWLHEAGVVQDETEGEEGYRIRVRWSARQKADFARL